MESLWKCTDAKDLGVSGERGIPWLLLRIDVSSSPGQLP